MFSRLKERCGLSNVEVAKRLGVHPNTVSQWATGARDVPGPVRAYLELYASVKELTV